MDHRGLELARRLDGVVVVRRRHNSHLKAKELRDWLRKSANWNGVAIVYDPYERVNIPADDYKRYVCEGVMSEHDAMSPAHRALACDGKEIPQSPAFVNLFQR